MIFAPTVKRLESSVPYLFDSVEEISANSLLRYVTVKPSMCGHNSLLVGRIGDWTWEIVSHACGINVFNAKDAEGIPTYLSFYYYHLLGDSEFYLHRSTFGDVLQVASTCFAFTSESLLSLHRLTYLDERCPAEPVTLEEFFLRPRPGCLYAMNVNRWIKRGAQGNGQLCSATPVGFRFQHLPSVPHDLSPRLSYDKARRCGHFEHPVNCPRVGNYDVPYDVDVSRDFNGVGLLYFSSFFSIVDKAVSAVWARLGRTYQDYFARRVTAERVLYLGNADAGAALSLKVTHRATKGLHAVEHLDIQIQEIDTQRLLAIADVLIQS
jgi:probable biosynthetic protein (TIGR04098 family)